MHVDPISYPYIGSKVMTEIIIYVTSLQLPSFFFPFARTSINSTVDVKSVMGYGLWGHCSSVE